MLTRQIKGVIPKVKLFLEHTCSQDNVICVHIVKAQLYLLVVYWVSSRFGDLGVACWPLVPKFAGSNPAETVGFLGRKNPQHAFLRRGSKAVGPMS